MMMAIPFAVFFLAFTSLAVPLFAQKLGAANPADTLLRGPVARNRSLIVEGVNVDSPTKYHFFGSTKHQHGFQRCGASLVHEDVALTAAHCGHFHHGIRFETLKPGQGGITRDVDNTRNKIHPLYNQDPKAYDYRVFRLTQPVPTITPVTMNDNPTTARPGDTVTVLGFGTVNPILGALYGQAYDLKEVNLPVRNSSACAEEFAEFREDQDQICVGNGDGTNFELVESFCDGDSGGPILSQGGTLVGIVAYGNSDRCDRSPGVAMSVAFALDTWIKPQICILAANPPDDCPEHLRCSLATPKETLPFGDYGEDTNVGIPYQISGHPWQCTSSALEDGIVWYRYRGSNRCIRYTNSFTTTNTVLRVLTGECDDLQCFRDAANSGHFFAREGMVYSFVLTAPGGGVYDLQVEDAPVSITDNWLVPCEAPFDDTFFMNSYYGGAVAIDGETAVVGAFYISQYSSRKGAVFVFERIDGVWEQVAVLIGSDGADLFGTSVDIQTNEIVVSSSRARAVYIFDKLPNGLWPSSETYRIPSPDSSSFGESVAISSDTIVVSGRGEVWVFEKDGSSWSNYTMQPLTASDNTNDNFGRSLSIFGNRIVVGLESPMRTDGGAYVYEKGEEFWIETAKLRVECDAFILNFDRFAETVLVLGETIFVGAHEAEGPGQPEETGAVYVFEHVGDSEWVETAVLMPYDAGGTNVRGFGFTLAASGNRLVVGASDGVYVFEKRSGTWVALEFEKPTDYAYFFAQSVAISGSTILLGNRLEFGGAYIQLADELSESPIQLDPDRCISPAPSPPPIFQPPRVRGDPHITTFDGMEYDCQGEGEFVLVRSTSSSFEVQARFSSFESVVKARASTITGVAIRASDIPIVEISFETTENGGSNCSDYIRLFVGGTQRELASGSGLSGVTVSFDGHEVVLSYSIGLELHLIVRHSATFGCFFSYWAHFTEIFFSNGDTFVGLLGSPNNNPLDDFMTPAGDILEPPTGLDAYFQAGYEYCTTNWCIRDADDSLFTYTGDETFESFFNCDAPYDARIESAVAQAPATLRDVCGYDIDCLIDGLVGDLSDAENYLSDEAEVTEAVAPIVIPTDNSTDSPTAIPSILPSATPTLVPSAMPTLVPSATPTLVPSATPTFVPSEERAVTPSAHPSNSPDHDHDHDDDDEEMCFSALVEVQVQGKGITRMEDLKIGDSVATNDGSYSKVYSFAHFAPNQKVEYLQINADNMIKPLEISHQHMLYVQHQTKEHPSKLIPARDLQVGDTLVTQEGGSSVLVVVKSIRNLTRHGAYAPLTVSGDIVVNDVVASNYIDLPLRKYLSFEKLHWLQHGALTPYRLYCGVGGCERETYDEATGLPKVVSLWLSLVRWLDRQSSRGWFGSASVAALIYCLGLPALWILLNLAHLAAFLLELYIWKKMMATTHKKEVFPADKNSAISVEKQSSVAAKKA